MSSVSRKIRGGVLAAVLTAAMAFAPRLLAQGQQPEPPSGAARPWQGRSAGTPPHGTPPKAQEPTVPQGMPAVGTPGGAAARRTPLGIAPGKKTPAGEQFFIVASVDLQKSQLLLKYPTEVTLLMHVGDSTKFVDDSGQPLKLSDFRAGDTVWVNSRTSGEEITAARVRKGGMNVADLHRYYLNYAEIK